MRILLVYPCLFLPPNSTHLWKYSLGFAVPRSRGPVFYLLQKPWEPWLLAGLCLGGMLQEGGIQLPSMAPINTVLLAGLWQLQRKSLLFLQSWATANQVLHWCSNSFVSLRYLEWFILFTHLVAGLSITNASSILASQSFFWEMLDEVRHLSCARSNQCRHTGTRAVAARACGDMSQPEKILSADVYGSLLLDTSVLRTRRLATLCKLQNFWKAGTIECFLGNGSIWMGDFTGGLMGNN